MLENETDGHKQLQQVTYVYFLVHLQLWLSVSKQTEFSEKHQISMASKVAGGVEKICLVAICLLPLCCSPPPVELAEPGRLLCCGSDCENWGAKVRPRLRCALFWLAAVSGVRGILGWLANAGIASPLTTRKRIWRRRRRIVRIVRRRIVRRRRRHYITIILLCSSKTLEQQGKDKSLPLNH